MTIRAALIAGLLTLTTTAFAQDVKVGYINLTRIEKESATAVRLTDALKQEFDPRNQQIDELQKRIAAAQARFTKEKDQLSSSEFQTRSRELSDMMRQSDQMVARLTEDFEMRKNEYGTRIFEEARVAIRAVAEAGKYDLILQEATYARSSVDVTDQVLKEMAKRGAAAK